MRVMNAVQHVQEVARRHSRPNFDSQNNVVGLSSLHYTEKVRETSPAHAPAAVSRELLLHAKADDPSAVQVFRALASEPRLRILELLSDRRLNASEIAQALSLPLSTTTMHLGILENTELITTERKPAARGSQRVCARTFDTLQIQLPQQRRSTAQTLELSMPIGAFSDSQVAPSCGLASRDGIIGLLDDPTSFYEPERLNAQLLWFRHGYVEYHFPNRVPSGANVESVQVSFELCSGTPFQHDPASSDMTVWLGGLELGSWTAPADSGSERGALTPAWWETHNTCSGLLKVWQVTNEGSLIDGLKLGDVGIEALALEHQRAITVRLGVKEAAHHAGGLTLFGRSFGTYPQDIVLRVRYT